MKNCPITHGWKWVLGFRSSFLVACLDEFDSCRWFGGEAKRMKAEKTPKSSRVSRTKVCRSRGKAIIPLHYVNSLTSPQQYITIIGCVVWQEEGRQEQRYTLLCKSNNFPTTTTASVEHCRIAQLLLTRRHHWQNSINVVYFFQLSQSQLSAFQRSWRCRP